MGDSESSSFPHPRSPGGRRAVRLRSWRAAQRRGPPAFRRAGPQAHAGVITLPSGTVSKQVRRRVRRGRTRAREPPLLPKGHSAVHLSQTDFGGGEPVVRRARPARSSRRKRDLVPAVPLPPGCRLPALRPLRPRSWEPVQSEAGHCRRPRCVHRSRAQSPTEPRPSPGDRDQVLRDEPCGRSEPTAPARVGCSPGLPSGRENPQTDTHGDSEPSK